MLNGGMYDSMDPLLLSGRVYSKEVLYLYNQSHPLMKKERYQLLKEYLLGECGPDVYIEPPFRCDYGSNIYLSSGVYMNFNCVLLDVCTIHIGEGTMLAPNVQIYTATHPVSTKERRSGRECGAPVIIGKHCWIGGGAIINPGVRIGDGAVIGSGSVVMKDVPSYTVSVGNPAKVIRILEEDKANNTAM